MKGDSTMKKLILLMCVLLGTSAIALAGSCPTATLDNYLGSGFSCDISDKTFSNWLWAPTQTGGAGIIPATGVLVTPLPLAPPGFVASFAGRAGAGQTQDALFGFTVMTNGAPITDASLTMFGAQVFGDGSVTIGEDLCSDDLWSDGCAHGTILHLSTCLSDVISCNKITDHIDFTGEQFIDVRKDIELNGGANGAAFLSDVEEHFSQGTVPEPSSILLFGSGILGLAGVMRRKLNF
jgi:hypothetical protein